MYKKLLLPLFLLLVTANRLSFAAASGSLECVYAESTKKEYAENQGGPNLETTSVFDNLFGAMGSFSHIASNDTPEMLEKCGAQRLKEVSTDVSISSSCEVEDPARCENMGFLKPTNGYKTTHKPSGSLLGIATVLGNGVKDPIPLNLAYYVNQNAQKIPGLKNTALAASGDVNYNGPFLGIIYQYWTVTRNIAYSFLAIVMLVVGVLIITRQKIDAKASVTVQQALPQIIIALILITFSYPIGAAGASIAFNIRGSMDNMAQDLFDVAEAMDVPTASIVNFWTSLAGFGTGIVAEIMGLVSVIVAAIMGILVLLKIFGIYLKMLFATITAPLSFGIGAIPGNQSTTMNWFKQYAAYMISIPAMSFGAWITWGLIEDIGTKAVTGSVEEWGGWGLGTLAALVTPAITFFGYTLVLSIPEKIEGILGIKGKK